jgi:hypothetical protein
VCRRKCRALLSRLYNARSRLPHLLNGGEEPFALPVPHEGPEFRRVGGRLIAAFDDIPGLSRLLAGGHRVVARRPLEFGRGVVRSLFRPGLLEIGFREDHVFDVICDFLTRLLGQLGAEVGQHFGRDEPPQGGEVLLAPGGLNVDQELLEGRLIRRRDLAFDRRGPERRGRRRSKRRSNGRKVQQGPACGRPPVHPGEHGHGLSSTGKVIENPARQDHKKEHIHRVESARMARRAGLPVIAGLRRAVGGAEEHMADPRAGDAGRDAGQYGMPLEDGGIALGRRGRTGGCCWRRGRRRLGRGRLLDRLPGVLIVGA